MKLSSILARLGVFPGLPLALLLAGLALTWYGVYTSKAAVHRQTTLWLESQQLAHTLLLEERLALLVESTRRFAAARINSQQQFRHRAGELLTRHPDIRGVELVRRIPHALRDLTEQQLSQEAGQPVHFHPWSSEAGAPADTQAQYLVIRWALTRSPAASGTSNAGILVDTVAPWRRELALSLEQQSVTATSLSSIELDGTPAQTIRLFVPTSGNELVSIALAPERWLGGLYGGRLPPGVQLTVHDLSNFNKTPLYQHLVSGEPDPDEALRSEVTVGNRQWMLTSVPVGAIFESAAAEVRGTLWSTGLLYAVGTALVVTWLLLLQRRARRRLAEAEDDRIRVTRRIENLDVEKTILRQALDESGERTRDLVQLAGGFVVELDEQQRIGFISDQATDMLARARASLVGQPLDTLVTPPFRENFLATLKAAREERKVERIDLDLLSAEGEPVAVTLRVKAVINPVDGCTGFRITALARH